MVSFEMRNSFKKYRFFKFIVMFYNKLCGNHIPQIHHKIQGRSYYINEYWFSYLPRIKYINMWFSYKYDYIIMKTIILLC